MVNRKNAEQIQEEILSHLKEGPKSPCTNFFMA